MDYKNYNRCRQFTPPGWGTARTLAPCGRADRAVQFRLSECRPTLAPIIIPAQGGMNTARNPNVEESPDPCHGRRFCPPATQTPINVHLNMCQVGDNAGMGGQCKTGQGGRNSGGGVSSSSGGADPYCAQCPNTCPLPRCPPGTKVERRLPIIPPATFLQSNWRMPDETTYKMDYVPCKRVITQSFAPERVVASSTGDFEHLSVTHLDFPAHRVCPYEKPPWSFGKQREINMARMNGVTSYKFDYVPKQGSPAPSAKPLRFIDSEAPAMDDRTVYQVEYIEHPLPDKDAALNRKQEAMAHCEPFDGLTTYKQQYIPKYGKAAESVMKERRFMKDIGPMEHQTTYKISYEPFYFGDQECIPADIYDQMYPPQDKCCPVRCFPEDDRTLEDPVQPPVPPCLPPQPGKYCPTPREMLCAPRVQPCLSPYILKKENNFGNDCTTIRVEHNMKQQTQNDPIEYICDSSQNNFPPIKTKLYPVIKQKTCD